MRVVWAPKAWEDYVHWQSRDQRIVARINVLIAEICRNPFHGTGKPEPLRGILKGWWSRRIGQEHRLVYRVVGKGDSQSVEIIQCRYHY